VLLPSQAEPAGHGVHDVRVIDVPPDVSEPAPHVLQVLAPAALCAVSLPQTEHVVRPPAAKRPAVHCACVLLPSQAEPAGHGEQVVRVVDVPPDVSEPAPHVLQVLAPAALCAVSAPQAVCVLLPSQAEPAGHAVHDVRVFDVPPDVSEPALHVLQLLALAALCAVSLPQAEHGPAPPGPDVPAPQGSTRLASRGQHQSSFDLRTAWLNSSRFCGAFGAVRMSPRTAFRLERCVP
jgi:hypothetical protein